MGWWEGDLSPPAPQDLTSLGFPAPADGNLLCPSTGVTQPWILSTWDVLSAPWQEFSHYYEQQEMQQMQWEP